jgi:hypothetical protein
VPLNCNRHVLLAVRPCAYCEKPFKPKTQRSRCCSSECYRLRRNEINAARQRDWRLRNTESARLRNRTSYANIKANHPEKHAAAVRQKADYRRKQILLIGQQRRQYRKKIRRAALDAYGGLVCSCDHNGVPCGSHPEEFLGIDHINGDGVNVKYRGGKTLYAWLRKNRYPPGFRVLCHNCNMALGFYGHCPHSTTEKQRTKTHRGEGDS